jgi:hypothetical protein
MVLSRQILILLLKHLALRRQVGNAQLLLEDLSFLIRFGAGPLEMSKKVS